MTTVRCFSVLLVGVALAGVGGCSQSSPTSPVSASSAIDTRGKSTDQLMAPSYVKYTVFDEVVPGRYVDITIQGKPESGGYFVDVLVQDLGGRTIWAESWFKYGDAPPAGDPYLHDEIQIRLDTDGDGIWDWQDAHPNTPDNPDDEDCDDRRN